MGEWNTKIWFINRVDNVNWPPYRDWKADVSSVSPSSEQMLWRRANARNVSFSIPVRWSIYIVNSVDKPNFQLSCSLLMRFFEETSWNGNESGSLGTSSSSSHVRHFDSVLLRSAASFQRHFVRRIPRRITCAASKLKTKTLKLVMLTSSH